MMLQIPIHPIPIIAPRPFIHLLVFFSQRIFPVVNDAGREETAVAQSILDAQAQDHLEGEGI